MKTIRVLTIQDVSCFGQCSLTVALPVLSALGIETAIMPTAILSTHTSGFKGFTFRDLSGDLASIVEHWKKEGISFDAIYTGYLGNDKDIEAVLSLLNEGLCHGPFIVDPAFGDHGVLYGGFDESYVSAMRPLCAKADVLLPNLTEAAFLLGKPYKNPLNEDEINDVLRELRAFGAKKVILKGIGDNTKKTGFAAYDGSSRRDYVHERIPQDFHGTGDIFASVFVGALMRGLGVYDAGRLAADFTKDAIEATKDDSTHPYGVKFEPLLHTLESRLSILMNK